MVARRRDGCRGSRVLEVIGDLSVKCSAAGAAGHEGRGGEATAGGERGGDRERLGVVRREDLDGGRRPDAWVGGLSAVGGVQCCARARSGGECDGCALGSVAGGRLPDLARGRVEERHPGEAAQLAAAGSGVGEDDRLVDLSGTGIGGAERGSELGAGAMGRESGGGGGRGGGGRGGYGGGGGWGDYGGGYYYGGYPYYDDTYYDSCPGGYHYDSGHPKADINGCVKDSDTCPPGSHYHPNHAKADSKGCMKDSDMVENFAFMNKNVSPILVGSISIFILICI